MEKIEVLCLALIKGDWAMIEKHLRDLGIEPGSHEATRELGRLAAACSERLGKD